MQCSSKKIFKNVFHECQTKITSKSFMRRQTWEHLNSTARFFTNELERNWCWVKPYTGHKPIINLTNCQEILQSMYISSITKKKNSRFRSTCSGCIFWLICIAKIQNHDCCTYITQGWLVQVWQSNLIKKKRYGKEKLSISLMYTGPNYVFLIQSSPPDKLQISYLVLSCW